MSLELEVVSLIGVTWFMWQFYKPSIKVHHKKEIGVKRASVVYQDEKGAKLLVSETYSLQGKPDFIFETWGLKRYVPLEVKSHKLKEDEPKLGDLYQLAAYFLLIEEVYGKRPPYGKLVYANKTFTIRNTRRLRKDIKQTLKAMQNMLLEKQKPLADPSFSKCKNCICKGTVCEFNQGD